MKVGIQLFSVKKAMGKDPLGTMRLVADLGYRNWEICELFGADIENNYGLAGLPAKEGRRFVEDNGVAVIGSHFLPSMMNDEAEFDRFLDYQAEVGCWSPGLAIDFWENLDELKRKCDTYIKAAEKCQKLGMTLHYHNHYQEFQKFEGKTVWEHMAELMPADLVKFELDTYWAMRGGAAPAKHIEMLGERCIMLHQKDFPKDGPEINLFASVFDSNQKINWDVHIPSDENNFVEVGTGMLPIQNYIDAGNAAGTKYITLEQDFTKLDEIESIKVSMEQFKRFNGIEWD